MIFISDLVAICCFSSPDVREKPRLFLASFGKAAGTWITKAPKPFAPYIFTDSKESRLLWQNTSKSNSRLLF